MTTGTHDLDLLNPADTDEPGEPITAAELRVVTEYLGMDQSALATYLGVAPRTVRRWIAGDVPAPQGVADQVEELEQYTAACVGHVVAALNDARDPGIAIYPDSETLDPSITHGRVLPARWWRMVVARAVHEVPGVSIRYAHELHREQPA